MINMRNEIAKVSETENSLVGYRETTIPVTISSKGAPFPRPFGQTQSYNFPRGGNPDKESIKMASFAHSASNLDIDEDPAAPPFVGIRVVHDPVKGRCLENLVSRQAGDVLFIEEALVFSSFVEVEEDAPEGIDVHVNGQLLLRAFGEDIMAELHDVHEELSNLPRIECLDTARNFLQLVALMHLRDSLTAEDEEIWALPLTLLSRLTPGVYMQELVQTVRTFRHAYPRVLPAGMSDTDAATCLGVLNTNQLELEDYGGSGLFVGTAIMEHSCAFNCSYTTHGSTLYMASTKAISPGERLSIDYGNNFYSPTLVRKLTLFESYGFLCACRMCDGESSTDGAGATAAAEEGIGIDRKRAFWCIPCKQKGQRGIVCPVGPTTAGLRSVLCDSGSTKLAVQPVKKSAKTTKKGGKSKSKKSPLKAMSMMAGDEEEEEDEADEAQVNLAGIDTAALADALERVPLTWTPCSTCGVLPAASYAKKCISQEEHYRQNPPETYEEVLEAGNENGGYLHESHYLLFQALDVICQEMTNQARRLSSLSGEADDKRSTKKNKNKEKKQQVLFDPALRAMQLCVRLLDQVLPLVHQEKVVFYDRLGQLAVCAGQIELAQGVFGAAHQLSVLASGACAPQSQQLQALAERPPQTREELMMHYAKENAMDVDVDEDDDM